MRLKIGGIALTALLLAGCAGNADGTDSTSEEASKEAETSESAPESETATESESSAAETESSTNAESITVTDISGNEVTIASTDSVVALDNRSFQILDTWGVELAAAPRELMSAEVVSYKENDDIANIGNHKEPNFEMLIAAKPDLVITGQRFQNHHEEIQDMLGPETALVDLNKPEDMPLDEYFYESTRILGEIFGKQNEAEALIADFDEAVAELNEVYNPEETVMGVVVSGGSINYAAPSTGRSVGPLFDLAPLTPALAEDGSTNHRGDDISVEAIAESNPDWIIALDRDQSVAGAEGYKPAAEVLDGSAALANVTAVQKGQIIYAPENMYLHEDIILYTKFLLAVAGAMA